MFLLRGYYAPEVFTKLLQEYRPYPVCGDKNSLTDAQKARMIATGEQYLGFDWPVAKATDYMRYVTEGTREPYEGRNYSLRRRALGCLVEAEYAEAKGRFIPDIINGVWAIMDEAYWVVPAHNDNRMLPDFDQPIFVDLFSAGTAGLLSNVYYLFKEQMDAVTPLVTRRMEKVLDERIMTPFMNNIYWWSGLAGRDTCNWGPWIISNVLNTFAFVCKDKQRIAAATSFACIQLDQFIKLYGEDGACDEGPGYWSHAAASLFDCLCILCDMTGGAFAPFFKEPLIQNLGKYICNASLGDGIFANYEDCHYGARPSYDLVYRFGKKIGYEPMSQLGIALYQLTKKEEQRSFGPNVHAFYRHMQELLTFAEIDAAGEGAFPSAESAYLPNMEQITERQQEGCLDGLTISAKAGANNLSHNHNDIGGFMLFSDCKPAFIDIGSGQYTSQTFSSRRYEIFWTTAAYHNLPMVNGYDEKICDKKETKNVSYSKENGVTTFTADIAGCFPAEAGVCALQRTYTYDRAKKQIVLTDAFSLQKDENKVEFVFITPVAPTVEDGKLIAHVDGGRDVAMTFDAALTAKVEAVSTGDDMALQHTWGKEIYRTILSAQAGKEFTASFTFSQI